MDHTKVHRLPKLSYFFKLCRSGVKSFKYRARAGSDHLQGYSSL